MALDPVAVRPDAYDVSLWNREETCCSVLQMQKAPRGVLCIGLSL